MKRILFIDRDGTLINEAPPTYQIDSFEKLEFYSHALEFMIKIAQEFDYELVMVTNQDGLGTAAFPEDTFWPVQNFVMKAMENGISILRIPIHLPIDPGENLTYSKVLAQSASAWL